LLVLLVLCQLRPSQRLCQQLCHWLLPLLQMLQAQRQQPLMHQCLLSWSSRDSSTQCCGSSKQGFQLPLLRISSQGRSLCLYVTR
jgi:hypothetical protein